MSSFESCMNYVPNSASSPIPLQSTNSSTPTNTNGSMQMQQKNPKLYKTELCRSWMESGRCNYGERCQYAHGEREKRPVPRHPKYKTEACQSYHKTGYCPYGPRCHFIHNEGPSQLKALRLVQEMAIAGTNNNTNKKLMGSSSATSLSSTNNQYNALLQKNNSMNSFPNGQSQHQLVGKAQSFGNNQENSHSQLDFLPNIHQKGQQTLTPNSSLNSYGLGLAENPKIWSCHRESASRSLSTEQNGGILQRSRVQEMFQAITPQRRQTPLTPIERPDNSANSFGENELDPQLLLGNFCSSDDECSRSSIISSNVDSGTESPAATDTDTLTRINTVDCKKFMIPTVGQISETMDDPQRRKSDGDRKDSIPNNSISTASSSLASISSSNSSQPHQKLRLPVFERLSLNQ